MTLSAWDLLLYAGAVFVLFITPGPVWVALTARTLAGGFAAAWPLALGVVVGDMAWPLLAVLGVSWVVGAFGNLAVALKILAALMFVGLGVQTIRTAGRPVRPDSRLTLPGMWAGFAAGVAVILGNPKAILFYMGLLPGFFDLTAVTGWDIAAIVAVSQAVPLAGNLGLALLVDRLRLRLATPAGLRRINRIAGGLLIGVGLIIPLA